MVGRFQTPFPSASSLIAFESAGRLGNFSRAAEELRTSQSAISRHIAKLEAWLGARLFDRSRVGVRLTGAGSRLYDGVTAGLGTIERAVAEAREAPDGERVVIACSHDAWHLLFTPRLDGLRQALGGPSALRFSLHPGDPRDGPPDPDADLVFTWDGKDAGPQDLALPEAAGPVCSPGYAARNAAILGGPVGAWVGVTLLDSPVPGRSRASWEDWFEAAGRPDAPPRMLELDSYADVLRAAAAGQGIALGRRYWIERHVEAGILVPLGSGPVELKNAYHGLLTRKGRRKPLARDCLAFLARSIQG